MAHAATRAEADDYVIATGQTHSVREFCDMAFSYAGLTLVWEGTGIDQRGIGSDGQLLVRVDPRYFRPAEVDVLLGDATKAREELGWQPTTSLEELVQMMVEADMAALALLNPEGA